MDKEMGEEHELCESCRQKELEDIQERIEKIMTEKQVEIDQLSEEIAIKKERLKEFMESRQALGRAWGLLLLARSRVKLMRQTLENTRASQCQELEELKLIQKSNSRRDERLARVRTKNFEKKEASAQQEYAETRKKAISQMVELQVTRRQLVTDVFRGVFPIEVEPLSEADAGDEDYQSPMIDCDSVLEVDDGWMLSGVHQHSMPNLRIVTASMPADGNYSSFLKAVSERRKARLEATQQGMPAPVGESKRSLHPLKDPYLSTPAGLVYTALFVEVIATTLDQPLPHPLLQRAAIGEYGNPSRRKKDFLHSVAKLDDNILYLCFAQNVPLTAVTPGHTLQNLLALVTHTQLGRMGAFECVPEMMRYRGRHGSPLTSSLSHDLEDSQPPAVVYTADQSNRSHSSDLESSSESEDNFYSVDQEFEEMYDWEHLEPNIKELRLFEEEQIRARLAERTDQTSAQRLHQVTSEVEAHRDRLRRLDYDSTYLDYTASVTSTRNQTSASSVSELSEATSQSDASGGGFFGTLSSLWSSTFGSRPSSS